MIVAIFMFVDNFPGLPRALCALAMTKLKKALRDDIYSNSNCEDAIASVAIQIYFKNVS